MSKIPFILSNSTLTVYIDSNSYNINTDHYNFKEIVELLRSEDCDIEKLESLLSDPSLYYGLSEKTDGKAEFIDGKVFFNGQEVHSVIADRIQELVRFNLPIDPLLRFMENLDQNTSFKCRNLLFEFLSHKGLPITDDGCFLAYKAITNDFKDKRTNKIDNSIGTLVKMERKNVDDESSNDCSRGLHVGTNEYADGFAYGNDKIVIVKVNPKNVVTVPNYDRTKMRVCEYEVLYEKARVYSAPLTNSQGEEYDDYDEDYEEYLDEWEKEDV